MSTEVTSKNQIHQIIKTFSLRYKQGLPFSVDELFMYLPSYNKTKLKWDLEDACIMGYLGKRSEHWYYGKDERSLKEKISSLFGNETVTYTSTELEIMFKVRPQDIRDAITELVKEGVLEQHPFLGMNYWLKLSSESSN